MPPRPARPGIPVIIADARLRASPKGARGWLHTCEEVS